MRDAWDFGNVQFLDWVGGTKTVQSLAHTSTVKWGKSESNQWITPMLVSWMCCYIKVLQTVRWRKLGQVYQRALCIISCNCMWVYNYFVAPSLSRVPLFVIPRIAAFQASLSFTVSWSLLKLMFIESVMLSNYFILCSPRLFLLWIFPSIRVIYNALRIRWSKFWSFSFSTSPSNENSGLISFRLDWFGLLAVQGTLKSSLAPQFESISSSVLSLLYGPTLISIHNYVRFLCCIANYHKLSGLKQDTFIISQYP